VNGRESVMKDLTALQARMINRQSEVDSLTQGRKTFKQAIKGFLGQQKDVDSLMRDIKEVNQLIYTLTV
jgi:seryl-tRNA synthetase